MRYLTVLILACSLSACSWWPWRSEKTGNCLDDNSCDSSNPFEEALVGGTWYCYGVDRKQPWDCAQREDPTKVAVISERELPSVEPQDEAPLEIARAEMTFSEEVITDHDERMADREPKTAHPSRNADLFSFADSSFAVQLIALQTIEEIDGFVADHKIADPNYVRIRSQGNDWYVLILGIFSDRAEAQRAAAEWAAINQPLSKPWVRPLGPLKQAALAAEAIGS